MDPLILLLFALATALLVLTPGPIVSLIIAETLTYGPKHGMAVVLGALSVAAVFLALYVAGAASLIRLMPDWVNDAIRYAGAVFLLYLAYGMFRAGGQKMDSELTASLATTPASAFKKSVAAGATNPKTILFFAAFFPQFLNYDAPVMPQMRLLALIFMLVSAAGDSIWVLFASFARGWLNRKGGVKLIRRLSGSVLALGALLLLVIN